MSRASFVRAALRRDWLLARTHRAPFLFDGLGLVASCAVFFYLGRYAGEGVELFAFAVAGLSIVRLHAAVPRIVLQLNQGLDSGTLERLLASPFDAATVVLAESAFELARAAAHAAATIVLAVALFGAPASVAPAGLLAVGFGLILAVGVFAGLAILTAALLLLVRQAGALGTLSSIAMPLIAGAYFPVSTLPQPLEAVAGVLPFRAVVDLVRDGLLDGTFSVQAALATATSGTLLVAVALVAVDRAADRARRASTLAVA